MTPETKLAIRRWSIRKLRLLFDWLDDRLHNAEVRLREDISGSARVSLPDSKPAKDGSNPSARSNIAGILGGHRQAAPRVAPPEREIHPQAARGSETFAQWEARCSGVTSLPRKSARRRGLPARAFDLRFSTR